MTIKNIEISGDRYSSLAKSLNKHIAEGAEPFVRSDMLSNKTYQEDGIDYFAAHVNEDAIDAFFDAEYEALDSALIQEKAFQLIAQLDPSRLPDSAQNLTLAEILSVEGVGERVAHLEAEALQQEMTDTRGGSSVEVVGERVAHLEAEALQQEMIDTRGGSSVEGVGERVAHLETEALQQEMMDARRGSLEIAKEIGERALGTLATAISGNAHAHPSDVVPDNINTASVISFEEKVAERAQPIRTIKAEFNDKCDPNIATIHVDAEVKDIQQALKNLGQDTSVDGIFGNQSKSHLDAVIKQAQTEAGMTANGFYNDETRALLSEGKYAELGQALETMDSIHVEGLDHIEGIQSETALAVIYNKYQSVNCDLVDQEMKAPQKGLQVEWAESVKPIDKQSAQNEDDYVIDGNQKPVHVAGGSFRLSS